MEKRKRRLIAILIIVSMLFFKGDTFIQNNNFPSVEFDCNMGHFIIQIPNTYASNVLYYDEENMALISLTNDGVEGFTTFNDNICSVFWNPYSLPDLDVGDYVYELNTIENVEFHRIIPYSSTYIYLQYYSNIFILIMLFLIFLRG